MDVSVKALEEAVSIRRQIDSLEKRLSAILSGSRAHAVGGARRVSAATRAKLAAVARARWARIKAGKKSGSSQEEKRWADTCWEKKAFPVNESSLGGKKASISPSRFRSWDDLDVCAHELRSLVNQPAALPQVSQVLLQDRGGESGYDSRRRTHNEALSVAAMCVCNPDCSPFAING